MGPAADGSKTRDENRAAGREPTSAERLLWALLRGRKLEGLKFRRQVPVGPYVVDFICPAYRLVVEADGPFHDPAKDEIRDAWLRSKGFETLRFPILMINSRTELVMQDITTAVQRRPLIPGPFESNFAP